MNTLVRSTLAALALAIPALASTRPPADDRSVTAAEREFERLEVTAAPGLVPSPVTVRDLEQRIQALETELARVRARDIERLPVLGDADSSHSLWP